MQINAHSSGNKLSVFAVESGVLLCAANTELWLRWRDETSSVRLHGFCAGMSTEKAKTR